jgi:EAL domain-containing protein (putative c-di-GMP-specific phosphodiesterase class I)
VHGTVLPDEFIPVAERTGTIDELTRWVLQRATADAVTWRSQGHRWSVAVNVAMRNLVQDDFATIVSDTLEHTGCDPDLLTLELTETTVMTDTGRTIEVLHRLAALGVRLSVDDFGTGYSSLSYLQQLPVVELKIDKFFVQDMVRDPSAEAIVRSVLDLASNLGLEAVAEGVEDEATWQHLRRLGCAFAQGYHLARPMAPRDVLPWSERYLASSPTSAAVANVANVVNVANVADGHTARDTGAGPAPMPHGAASPTP